MCDLPKTIKVVIAGSRFLMEDSLRHHIQVLPVHKVHLYMAHGILLGWKAMLGKVESITQHMTLGYHCGFPSYKVHCKIRKHPGDQQ